MFSGIESSNCAMMADRRVSSFSAEVSAVFNVCIALADSEALVFMAVRVARASTPSWSIEFSLLSIACLKV